MTQRAERLLDEALQLSDADRADLAARLKQSLDSETDADADAAWDAEIERALTRLSLTLRSRAAQRLLELATTAAHGRANLRERKNGKYVGQTRIARTGRPMLRAILNQPAAPFIVTPGRCSDMAGSPIASMKAER